MTRFCTIATMSFLFVAGTATAADLPVDAPVPDDCFAQGDEGRYECRKSYEEVLKFYKRIVHRTGGTRWRSIINIPGIRAQHLQSLRKKTTWAGLNIYEHRGRSYIYVITRERLNS